MTRTAVIIGAGPAGLTAAVELLRHTDIRPLVLEARDGVGGIARTFEHHGNRIDLGGHRFFTKSPRVEAWWEERLPCVGEDPMQGPDAAMLVRRRVSRILHRGHFFDYPLSLSPGTLRKLGLYETLRLGVSYGRAQVWPVQPERSLEDFLINRFGRRLYHTFFRDYTAKVWGVPCHEIPADWGRQRIKGVSLAAVLHHAWRRLWRGENRSRRQEGTETSLIERFLYPKLGPGQMWESAAAEVRARGGDIRLETEVVGLSVDGLRVVAVEVRHRTGGQVERLPADVVLSTMPVRELVAGLHTDVPVAVSEVARGLLYRDFLTVGLLCRSLRRTARQSGRSLRRTARQSGHGTMGELTGADLPQGLPDTWIYIQEPGVTVGRMQIFNNWSPYLVADPRKLWIGLEYFVNETDALWQADDAAVQALAVDEMQRLGLLDPAAVEDGVVIRMPKAYPAYFGTYPRFALARDWLDRFENLLLIGRNGMHRYNNQDHSMLTAMVAVDGLRTGHVDKAALWAVNTEEDYHEERH